MEDERVKNKAVFNFGDYSDNDDNSSIKKKRNQNDTDNKSEGESNMSHIDKIDLYDRLNFKRIAIKRNTRKGKTELCTKKNFRIEKFTEDITKITEDLEFTHLSPDVNKLRGLEKERKKTIRFANKRTTYQYPKEKESFKWSLNDKATHYETEEEIEKKDLKETETEDTIENKEENFEQLKLDS